MFRYGLSIVVSVLALSLYAAPSVALVTTYEFTGTVTAVNSGQPGFPAILSGIDAGDSIVGSFSYDAATSSSTNPFGGDPASWGYNPVFAPATYYEIPNTLLLTIGGTSIPTDTSTLQVLVWNDEPILSDYDGFMVRSMLGTTCIFSISSTTLPSSTFNDESLPTTSINNAGLAFKNYRAEDYVAGNVGTLAASPVPIPPAIWLFGSGLVGLVGLKRRGRK